MQKVDTQPLIDAIDKYILKADDTLKGQLSNEGFIETEKTISAIKAIEDKLSDIFMEQLDKISDAIKDKDDLSDAIDAILDLDLENEKFSDVFENEFKDLFNSLCKTFLKEIDSGVKFQSVSDSTVSWIESWSNDLADIMELSTNEGLDNIFTNALDNGDSVSDITERLQDWYGFSETRARRTAVTEILTAHSAAANETYKNCAAVERKKWRHTGSHKNEPRENHIDMDGQTVPKDGTFTLFGADGVTYYPEYPRDPILPASERVNCHCILQPVVNKDILGLSEEERQKIYDEAVAEDNKAWEKELDAKNKAKAGINEDTVHIDWIRSKSKEDQIRYFGGGHAGKSRWALLESGVITDDKSLDKLYKTNSKGVRVKKTFQELQDSGIITIKKSTYVHSTQGEYIKPSKEYPNGRLMGGGHSLNGKNGLTDKNINFSVNKTFSNNVSIGNVENHKVKFKRDENGQTWFPDSWSDDDILVAGTYVANNKANLLDGYHKTDVYNNVAVRILIDDKGNITTICPDNDQDTYVEGVSAV